MHVQVFDLRMMRMIPPTSYASTPGAGTVFTRFMPGMSNMAVVGTQAGSFRLSPISPAGGVGPSDVFFDVSYPRCRSFLLLY